jgi:preprotein translocase subunit SecB
VQPPLQLEGSYFDVVHIEAVPEHKPAAQGESLRRHCAVRVDLSTIDAHPGMWRVTLDIEGKDDEATPPPYLFRLRGIGTFRYTGDDRPEPEIARIVGVNGASIVFSSAREYLMLLTSRGPWGQMRLPTVSFADLEVGATDEEIAEG